MPWKPYGITQYAIVSFERWAMIKFMVDLRTSSDGAAVAGIEELWAAVVALQARVDDLTRNGGGHKSSDDKAAQPATAPARPARKKAGE